MKEIEDILEEELVEGCCSCRKYKGADPKRRKMDVNSEYGMALVKRLKGNVYLQLLTNLILSKTTQARQKYYFNLLNSLKNRKM